MGCNSRLIHRSNANYGTEPLPGASLVYTQAPGLNSHYLILTYSPPHGTTLMPIDLAWKMMDLVMPCRLRPDRRSSVCLILAIS